MWVMRLNIVDWGYFKIQTLQEILKTENQHQVEHCVFGSHTFVPISWMCMKQTSVSHSSTESEITPLDAGLRMDGLFALELWDWSLKCWERPKEYQNQPKHAHGKLVLRPKSPKIEQVLDQNMDLSNVDQVHSNAHLSEKESQLYIFEDNEVVKKRIVKGRSPTMRHVSRTHRVALDWIFDRINLDPKVQISVSNPKTNSRSFTRVEWQNLLHLYNIMNDTTFSCGHFYSHSSLTAGKQFGLSQRSQERSSLGSPVVKAKACCLVSRHCASVGQDYSS